MLPEMSLSLELQHEPIDFDLPAEKTPAKLRERIAELEAAMFDSPARLHVEPVSYFAEGLYAREVTLPAGSIFTGKIHKFEHLAFIMKGDISVLTEHGVKRIQAPATLVSSPGTKRVVYVHEETIFTTVHACPYKTAEEAEENLVVDTFEKFEHYLLSSSKEETKCLT
jgi:hypothetical protein